MRTELIEYIEQLKKDLEESNDDYNEIFGNEDDLRVKITNDELIHKDLTIIHKELPFLDGVMLTYDRHGLMYKTILQDFQSYDIKLKDFIIYSFKGELEIFDEHVWVGGDELTKIHKEVLNNIISFLHICNFIDDEFYNNFYNKIGTERE